MAAEPRPHSRTRPTRWWSPLVHFLTHTIVGTVAFVIIALFAVGLNLLVHWLEHLGISAWLQWMLTAAEFILTLADIIGYVMYLGIAGASAIREFWHANRR